MTADRTPVVGNLAKGRARISNGKSLQLFGDGRSAGARRYRDLVRAFVAEFSATATISTSVQQIIRRRAGVCVELELMEAKRADGGEIDPIALVTLANLERRLRRDLERFHQALAPKPSLSDHLARIERQREDSTAA